MNRDWCFYQDYYRMTGKEWVSFPGIIAILTQTSVRYVFYLRILQKTKSKVLRFFVEWARRFLSRKTGIEIHADQKIGPGFRMVHPFNITISADKIGKNTNVFKGATIGYALGKHPGHPTIGDNCQIGINSTIIGGVRIGDDVLIAPNTFVNTDVPSHSIVVGNPAVVIHKDNATEQYVYFRV